ncbi:MAG: glycine hydroxymethyltransferase [Rhodoferax sp.]
MSETVSDAIDALDASLNGPDLSLTERDAPQHDLFHWHDDLRRAHLMSNRLAITELRIAVVKDSDTTAALESRDDREIALWMLAMRDKVFRDAELHLAFQARTNGKYWKKFSIQPGLSPTRDRSELEAFSTEVSKLYQKVGGGTSSHVEVIDRAADGSIQLAIYVEGPITALAHFSQRAFKRITTRVALETAIVYHPSSGVVETIVKGGAKNHEAVLALFGTHIVKQAITPAEIKKQRFNLNALRDGMLEPFEDWSAQGVEKVRLRRAMFLPMGQSTIGFQVEASPEQGDDDAIKIALRSLKFDRSFATSFNMTGASVIVYMVAPAEGKAPHFSFDVYSSGSSTIKNLSEKNQPIANAVLSALDVI